MVYEVFPRAFSPQGNFKGVTAQLDRLKELGVTVLWLMPIHPMGKLKAKGTLGSPYAVRDYDAVNPEYGTPRRSEAARRRRAPARHEGVHRYRREPHVVGFGAASRSIRTGTRTTRPAHIVPPNPDWVDVADLD